MQVNHCGRQPGMPHQYLDLADIVPGLQQMRGEAMPQRMNPLAIFYARLFAGFLVGATNRFVG